MPTTEKHQKQARSILTTVHTHCCCAICEDSIVAALESAYAEGGHAEFDRGWRHAEGEIAAAIPCDYKSLHGGKLWVVKMEELIRSAEERGKRDAAARCAEIGDARTNTEFVDGSRTERRRTEAMPILRIVLSCGPGTEDKRRPVVVRSVLVLLCAFGVLEAGRASYPRVEYAGRSGDPAI